MGGLGAPGSQNKVPETLARLMNVLQSRLDDENLGCVARLARQFHSIGSLLKSGEQDVPPRAMN